MIRLDRQGPVEQRHRLVGLMALRSDGRQQLQCVELPRLLLQDLAVDRLGQIELALLMHGERAFQLRRDIARRHCRGLFTRGHCLP